MKHKNITLIIAGCIFLIALGLLFYPLIASSYNTRHQSEIYHAYQEEVNDIDRSVLVSAMALANKYNSALVPGVQSEDAYSTKALSAASNDYADCLNLRGDGVMGFVIIPKIDLNIPILHGTTDATLEKGVGHLLGSSLPVGGESTHTVLTGHSGMAGNKMFSDLSDMKLGDIFYLEVLDQRLAYEVDQINTVLPYETELLKIIPDEDLCTLVTCTPFGVNTHRLLVRGHRITEKQAEVIADTIPQLESHSAWQENYLRGVLFGVGGVFCCGIVYGLFCLVRRRCHGKK